MDQQPARAGVPRDDVLENVLKILLRLVRCPIHGPWRLLFKVKASVVFRMAAIAAGVSWPFFQKDRLDVRFEYFETKGVCNWRSRSHRRPVRRTVANPGSEHLPFRILLRLPEFAARVRRVAARFRCQRMKQETATER